MTPHETMIIRTIIIRPRIKLVRRICDNECTTPKIHEIVILVMTTILSKYSVLKYSKTAQDGTTVNKECRETPNFRPIHRPREKIRFL